MLEIKRTKLYLYALAPLVLFAAAAAVFPKKTSAIGYCSIVGEPSISVSVAGRTFTSNGSITVAPGSVLSFHVDTYAEPSSINSISYPGGSASYPGPSGTMGTGRDYTTSPINSQGSINVSLSQNCIADPDNVEPVDLSITINVAAPCAINSFSCDNVARLAWSTANCSSRSISPSIGSVGATGNTQGSYGTLYTLTADGNTATAYCNAEPKCQSPEGAVGSTTTSGCGTGVCAGQKTCVNNLDGTASWGACGNFPTAACDDGNACTASDVCSNGTCSGSPAPVAGNWSSWTYGTWTNVGTCGQYQAGRQRQDRTNSKTCTNPAPACGGASCVGSATQTETRYIVCGSCTPGDTQTCGSGSCAGSQTCQSSGSWSSCSYPGSATSCSDGDSCTSNDSCDGAGSCVGVDNGSCSADYSLALSPLSGNISQGQSYDFTVTYSATNGHSRTVTLSGMNCPSGATCSFPNGTAVSAAAPTKILRVATSASTPAATYTGIYVRGSDGSLARNTNTAALTVTVPAGVCASGPYSQTLVSDTSTLMSGIPAVIITTKHPVWSSIPGANWIWDRANANIDAPAGDFTFTKTFTVPANAASLGGSMTAAADNWFKCTLNGSVLPFTVNQVEGFTAATMSAPATISSLPGLRTGANTLSCVVRNNPASPNPAGFTYKLTITGNCDPNGAICDSSWRALPIGGATNAQPVMTMLPTGANTQYTNHIGVFVRGTDNQGYFSTCSFNASNPCIWNPWQPAGLPGGGAMTYSPATAYNSTDGWANFVRGASGTSSYYKSNISTGWWPGASTYQYQGENLGYAYGQPFRTTDPSGRTWQIRRNSDKTMSYYCGNAPVCEDLQPLAENNGVSPSSVTTGQAYTVKCDYGVQGLDNIFPSVSGSGNSCAFTGYTGTTANFSCTSSAAGTKSVSCVLSNGGNMNTCGRTDSLGNITVTSISVPPTDPSGITAGGSAVCEEIKISWTDNSTDEDLFRVYRGTASNPGTAVAVKDMTTTSKATKGTTYEWVDSSPSTGNNYYWVTAVKSDGTESARSSGAANVFPISPQLCEANMTTSDKDIVAVNGTLIDPARPFGNVNGSTDVVPLNIRNSWKAGDTLRFSINLVNNGTDPATAVEIYDYLVNLVEPEGGWNAKYYNTATGAQVGGAISPAVSGELYSQTLYFDLRNAVYNIPVGGSRSLVFEAKLAYPPSYTGNSPRFQNAFALDYDKSPGVSIDPPVRKTTPLMLFGTGRGGPSIIEVP